jgi:hypothetical protein
MITDTQDSVSTVQTVESPAAYLTLTRTATLPITTAGTSITWQTATRFQGISWSGTTVTILSEGYYHFSVSIALLANTNTYIRFIINGVNSHTFYTVPFNTGGGFASACTAMLYLQDNDTVLISLVPAANTTLNQNGEGFAGPSPFIHIVQLSGVV